MPTDYTTVLLLLPEMTLVVLAVWIFIGGTLTRNRLGWGVVALATLMLIGIALFRQDLALRETWSLWEDGLIVQYAAGVSSGPILADLTGHTFRQFAVLLGVLFLLAVLRADGSELSGEYLGSLVLVFVGLMLACCAGDLVLMFLGLELISVPTYVLLFLGRRGRAPAEATAKYFYLSILSSSLLLYGFSFLYGASGAIGLYDIHDNLLAADAAWAPDGLHWLVPLAMVLVFAGLGFKIAAVPFHFYAPDVYQGTTNINAGLLAVVPKVAGIVALVRLTVLAMPTGAAFGWKIALALAVITMTLGNVCALWQKNFRRLMAYSSIAHAGYMLIGLAVALAEVHAGLTGGDGIAAVFFYLIVYAIASLGTFAALAHLGTRQRELNRVDELAGLARTRPVLAGCIALFMFSLAGIPPLAGFWGKLMLLAGALGLAGSTSAAATSQWFLVLAVIGALNAAIAAAYYLRVVGVLYFQSSQPRNESRGASAAGLATLACAVLIVAGGVVQGPLLQRTRSAGQALGLTPPRATSRTATMDPDPDGQGEQLTVRGHPR